MNKQKSVENNLISIYDPKSPISESYRVLRTNIQFTSLDRSIKTVMVTSSVPGEGKTTVIANLAVVIAQKGKKVLLVDTDLRKPRVHKVFDIKLKPGLTTLLAQRGNVKEYVQASGVKGLDILSCGPIPPNPSELIDSNAMNTFVEELKEQYDIILFDSPPVLAATDAAVLSTLCEGTILVCNSGKVAIEAAQRAKELLQRVNANILGVVLNKIEKDSNYTYYYYEEEGQRKKVKRKKGQMATVREETAHA